MSVQVLDAGNYLCWAKCRFNHAENKLLLRAENNNNFFSNVLLTYMSINIYYKVLETFELVRETSKCFARARNIEIMRGKLQS